MASITRDVEFKTYDGVTLRGTLYPAGDKRPAIIMSNGLGGLRFQFLADHAQRFQAAGYTTLVYDNRGLGDSDGRRNDLDPVFQVRDYMDAFIFTSTLPEVDPSKIVYWGSSFSGGNAIMAASVNKAIAGVIVQVPFVSGEAASAGRSQEDSLALLGDRANVIAGGRPAMIPIQPQSDEEIQAIRNGTSKLLIADPDQLAFWEEIKSRGWEWTNFATLQGMIATALHEPMAFIHRIAPTPLLMLLGDSDKTISPKLQLQAFEKALEPKTLHILKGKGHYEPYYGPTFEENVEVQVGWLKKLFAE